jgi:membrane protease YdiL (CAAX protease family)
VLLAVVYVVGGYAVYRLLALGFAHFGVSQVQIRASVGAQSLFLILVELFLDLGVLAYLAVQMRYRFEAPFWRTVGWRRLETRSAPRPLAYLVFILSGFLFSILIQVVSAAFGTKAKMPIEQFFQDRRSALLLMLMGILIAPVVEETIFRGYIYPVVARSFGLGAGVLLTGTIFGLLHAPQLWGGWVQIILLVIVGVVFTGVRAATKTVVASYLLHVSYNFFLFFAFVVFSSGFRHFPVGH